MHRRRIPAAAVTVMVCAAAIWAFRHLGSWLVVEDAPAKADAIFVPAGDPPFRAAEAARLFTQGFAPEVWLALDGRRRRERYFAKLGIEYPGEREYNRAALLRLGVPEQAIHIVDVPVYDTYDEVKAVSTELARRGGRTLIITSSQYHTRRIRLLWSKLAAPGQRLIVRAARQDGFRAAAWWKNSSDALAVAREVMGIVNAWIGFPVRTRENEPGLNK